MRDREKEYGGASLETWPSHHVVDGRGMHEDAAVALGHEAELVGSGLHLHGSFAGHLVVSLRGSHLRRRKEKRKGGKREIRLVSGGVRRLMPTSLFFSPTDE